MKTSLSAFAVGFICGSIALSLTSLLDNRWDIPHNYNSGVFDGIIFTAVFLAARRATIEFINDEMSQKRKE